MITHPEDRFVPGGRTGMCSTAPVLVASIAGRRIQTRLGSQQMTVESSETTAQGLILTDAAAAKVKSLPDQQGEEGLQLRVAVKPGGCSWHGYQIIFDYRLLDGGLVTCV